ncbi:hypothetical protein [Catelliglobosispora koreensis]|uniref:hypothetical protein n=1 Tax=Catelliglobosispora koreensis TaxID=129052 RepID=UPI00037D5575|nr:hypothetical protein [Catelliglobosispora koreensis]
MITFDNTTSVERKLLVFTDTPGPRWSLRRVIAAQLAYLFDDDQIDGWYGIGDTFNVEQIMQPGFRYPGGAQLWGWLDHNALWRIPAWPADASLPPVLAETVEGWMEGAFGNIGYDIYTPATVVTVSVPVPAQPSGICRCGHDASEHNGACTSLVSGSTLGCGCLTWRAPRVVTP